MESINFGGISMIDRKELVSGHNPVLEEMDKESALTVGNGEFAFTSEDRKSVV